MITPPTWLTEAQREIWHEVSGNAPRALSGGIDAAILTTWVLAEERYRVAAIAQARIDAGSALPLMTKGEGGRPAPSPYIAQLKLSNFKMSAEENFIGATVSYIDGDITNTGDKTVTRVMVQVNFEDSIGQLAQREDLPLRIIRTNGAYLEPVDLATAPLAPGQTEPYRLTFDSISAQWNHQYPDITITAVTTK